MILGGTEQALARVLAEIEIDTGRLASAGTKFDFTMAAWGLRAAEVARAQLCKNKFPILSRINGLTQTWKYVHACAHGSFLAKATAWEHARLKADCIAAWKVAQRNSNFDFVERPLNFLFRNMQESAKETHTILDVSTVYDVVLDAHTPGLTCAKMDSLLSGMVPFSSQARQELVKRTRQHAQDEVMDFPLIPSLARDFAKFILEYIGVNTEKIVFRQAAQSMCQGTYDKIYVGLDFEYQRVVSFAKKVLYEGGRALYRQNLPPCHKNTMFGQVCGTMMDEAVGMIFQHHVGGRRNFIKGLIEAFAVERPELVDFVHLKAGERAAPDETGIRTNADEIRLPLDIAHRYRLERALFAGQITVRELPEVWNQEYRYLTGIDVMSDYHGVLQDMDWYMGDFGRFPSQLAGQAAAAQLMEAAHIAHEYTGHSVDVLGIWLKDNVFCYGAKLRPLDLIHAVTGRPLDCESLKRHFIKRYSLWNVFPQELSPGLN